MDIDAEIKYLGFMLKPNSYGYADWNWLVIKVQARIESWTNRLLSRGGRLVLIKSVIYSIPVYWATIANIPKGIFHQICKLIFKFLWSGKKQSDGIPLVKWSTLARPKDLGGWGIHNLLWFSRALAAKSLWRLMSNNMLWGRVLMSNYLAGKTIEEWFCMPRKSVLSSSTRWKAMVDAFPLLGKWAAWRIGNGRSIRVGEDPWEGSDNKLLTTNGLLRRLHVQGIHSLRDTATPGMSITRSTL
jgi:hypothetical protein